ncbi:MAG: HPF/RaiA family ribosome-associated protein [Planctomycetota bacterium]|nr:HPF/RaiA family ribosome-associated protein [Planctomycetota bacterium]
MTLKIFDGKLPTSPAILDRLRQRIGVSLRALSDRVGEVTVWIADINGRKGGTDKRCRIVAQVASAAPIVVESRHADYYRAIDLAASKLRQAAERRRR